MRRQYRQSGVTLVEALVAMLIMAFGMLAMAGLQGTVRRSADLSKQRGEATRLVQQELELLRSFSVLDRPADAPAEIRAFNDITSREAQVVQGAQSNTQYVLSRDVNPTTTPVGVDVRVQVRWIDRTGQEQTVGLSSLITRIDPALSGSLSQAPDAVAGNRPRGRHASIPQDAKDLGDGRSAFKPHASGTQAWVFDNKTGVITSICGTSATIGIAAFTARDLSECAQTQGFLLSGVVRFSFDASPSAENPASPALAGLDLMIVQATALPSPKVTQAPPVHECFDDSPTSNANAMAYVSYHCIVYPSAAINDPSLQWSGRLNITGIALSGDHGHRICRYSADYDQDGVISNAEHPGDYYGVKQALTHQNFLVIAATQDCPVGNALDPSQGHFVNTQTLPHQPGG